MTCKRLVALSVEFIAVVDADVRAKLGRNSWLIITAGFFMGLHFGAWVWGLQHTSLPHSLFIVSSVPVVIAVSTVIMGHAISKGVYPAFRLQIHLRHSTNSVSAAALCRHRLQALLVKRNLLNC